LAVSSFRLRARLDLSIPSAFSGQRGCEPRFLGYGAPHLSAKGTLTLLNNALLSAHFLTIPPEGLAYLNRGDVLTFVAAGLYAVHIILVGEYTRQHSSRILSVVQVATCAVMAWVTAGAAAAIRWQVMRFEWRSELVLGVLICAVFATAVAFSIQLWAQQYTSSSHAAILFTLEPVFAVITSYLLIGERLNARAILGAVFVLAGILVAEMLGPPAAPESPEPTVQGRIYFEPWWRL
jgi:drug/metabolite transporter (DMT)-like permease